MNAEKRADGLNRREFLGQGALGAAAVGLGLEARAAVPGDKNESNPWRYDVEALRRVDPAWLHYELVTRIDLGTQSARRLAVGADGRLWVAAGKSLLVFLPDGRSAATVELDDAPRAVRVGSDQSLFVAFRDHVRVLDPSGKTRSRWGAIAGKPFLTGLVLDERAGEALVADSGNRVVYRYDLKGRIQLRLGEKNPDRRVPGLVLPSPFLDVELAGDSLVAINNPGRHQVEFYTRDGDWVRGWGRAGAGIETFCGCCNPIAVAPLADGRVVVAEKGLPRVKVYSSTGTLESVVAGPQSFAAVGSDERETGATETTHDGLDVVVAGDGLVWVMDLVGGTLQSFRRKASAPGTTGDRGETKA